MGVAKKKQESAMELCLHFPPFLVHVALVLIVGWIGSRLNCNLPLVFAFGMAYLYFVEGRIKAKTESRIRSEERRVNDRKRLLSDAETARWLNSTVEAVWPIFLENFASQKFLLSLAPYFLEKYKPWTAKKVVLQQICLGRCPPVFSMLRCGSNPTDGDHLVLEMDMKFVAARDMSAVIAVQIKKRVGLGLWTSLNISNIQIEGKLRVGVRFTKGWPVVERLRVCFSEAPILRMTAKPIINYGIDVTDLPGIASWIDKMIADALEHSLVEPNVLEVDVEKLVGSMMAVSSKLRTPMSSKPGPWFSVRTPNIPLVACLTVEILEGKKLKPSDPNGKADPYVKLRLGSGKSVTTTIKHKTLQPAWHEKFYFPVESWDVPNKLQLRVRDKDRFGHDDHMGHKEIECKAFNDGQRHEMWVTLDEVKTGLLRIAITVEEVPVVAVTEGTETISNLESGSAQNDVPPSGEKVRIAAVSQRHENDQDSPDSDYEECLLQGEREAVDVGYGDLGAVSILTPGKAKVKEATSLERIRQRRKPAASRVEVDGEGRSADCTDPVGVTTAGKRSRLKRFWKKDRKSSSQSDSSGELGFIARGEKGTEVHMTVETEGEERKDVVPPAEGIPSSGELQDCGEDHYEESRAENRNMKKVQNIMLKFGQKAHIMSSAISKMSPSKKRSHSGKNLGEIPVTGIQAMTDIPEASSTRTAAGDMENMRAEITSPTGTKVYGVNDIETSEETQESEAGKGNSYITRYSFIPTAPSTTSDQAFPSVDHPTPTTDADYVYRNSVPTATSSISGESVPPTPIRDALKVSSGSGSSSSTDITTVKTPIKDDLDASDTDAVLPSRVVVRNPSEEQGNGLRTSPKVLTEDITQIPPTKIWDSHSEAAEGFGQAQLVERTILTDLKQESSNLGRASDFTELNLLSDCSHDDAILTDSKALFPPSRPPPEVPSNHQSSTAMKIQ